MEIFTFSALCALVAKLAVGIGGATGVAKGVSWFGKKTFSSTSPKKAGVLHDRFKHESEES